MFIIFDLDDTLIDTSGCITPVKLEMALSGMMKAGHLFSSFEEALELIKRLDATAESARHALEEFAEILGVDKKFLDVALGEMYGELPEDLPIFPVEDALEILSELSGQHRMALVTAGQPKIQMYKLKKAGIDFSFFSKIIVSEAGDKQRHYWDLLQALDLSPRQVIVCGDRIASDLSPAKKLGCYTVHMRWGRGLHSKGKSEDVDFSIGRLEEMRGILSWLENI